MSSVAELHDDLQDCEFQSVRKRSSDHRRGRTSIVVSTVGHEELYPELGNDAVRPRSFVAGATSVHPIGVERF